MSSWSYALTNKGRQLQAKAQAGAQLVYTRMAVGSGTLSGQSLESMTALIAPVKDLTISRLKRPAGATRALIGATLTNQDVTTGFYLREIGIFADDPDDGEILYMYANSGATADYIAPQGDGVIEKALNMNVFVGSAANITANIDESLVYATQQDLADAIAGIQINDATTTQKGIVQLSNATNSTAENLAATPKAVKLAYDAAVAAQTTANAANTAAANAGTKADTAIAQLADVTAQGVRYAADTGTDNAKVVTLPAPVPTAYFEGMAIAFKNKVLNTGAVTININGLGAKSILKSNGSALASGSLKADSIYTIRYNGTAFILQGEGGEYGTATAADVRSTKTIGTENGVVQGTLDLTNLVAGNVKSGVNIGGIIGSLQARHYERVTQSIPAGTSMSVGFPVVPIMGAFGYGGNLELLAVAGSGNGGLYSGGFRGQAGTISVTSFGVSTAYQIVNNTGSSLSVDRVVMG